MSSKASGATKVCVIYTRISKDDKEDEAGVKRQEKECRALAQRLGWPVSRVYSDNDLSAYNRRVVRPQYRDLLDDIRAGRVTRLVIWHTDRLYRQPRELEDLVDIVEISHLDIATVRAGDIDLGTSTGRMVARMLGAAAAHESEHKAERLRSKMAELREAGAWTGGPRPFGWDIVRDDHGKTAFKERPEETAILREATRRVLDGESLHAIAVDFERRGIRSTRGKPLYNTTLGKMLVSPRMIGMMSRDENNGRDRKIIGKGQWKPVVSEADWTRLRSIVRHPGRNTRAGRVPKRYLLTGSKLLFCGLCGSPLYGRPRHAGREQETYHCKASPGLPGCGRISIAVAGVDDLVQRSVIARLSSKDFARTRHAALKDVPDLREATRTLADVNRDLHDLAADFGAGRISRSEWAAARKPLEARREQAQKSLEMAEGSVALSLAALEAQELTEEWGQLPVEKRRAVIKLLLEKIVVNPAPLSRRGHAVPATERVELHWLV